MKAWEAQDCNRPPEREAGIYRSLVGIAGLLDC
jgi:hypothetical protein